MLDCDLDTARCDMRRATVHDWAGRAGLVVSLASCAAVGIEHIFKTRALSSWAGRIDTCSSRKAIQIDGSQLQIRLRLA